MGGAGLHTANGNCWRHSPRMVSRTHRTHHPGWPSCKTKTSLRKSRLAVLDAVTLYTNLSMRKRKSKAPEQDEDRLRAGQRQLAATSSRSLSRTRTHGATKRVRITYVRALCSDTPLRYVLSEDDHAKVVFPPMNSIHTVRSYRASGEEQWHNII